MMRSLWTAASGMMAQQTNLDTISNNLANVNTPGFKKQRVGFQDLLYETLKPATGATSGSGYDYDTNQAAATPAVQVGSGVKIGALQRMQTPGTIEATGNPLDVAIDGLGFFQVTGVGGESSEGEAYTRDGSFRLSPSDDDGASYLVTQDGYFVSDADGDNIEIPAGTTEISIAANGVVTAKLADSVEAEDCGTIGLFTFANPGGLEALGKNLYRETAASGTGAEATPGEDGAGTLVQSYVERSNVQVVEEMVNLIVVQRAYEMNTKTVQSSDEIMGMTNNMVRR